MSLPVIPAGTSGRQVIALTARRHYILKATRQDTHRRAKKKGKHLKKEPKATANRNMAAAGGGDDGGGQTGRLLALVRKTETLGGLKRNERNGFPEIKKIGAIGVANTALPYDAEEQLEIPN
ncbi:hypothetical protein OUZ56_009202 [Daphnia magna]|uniref:Uncharacterized protein n=1 Tax=Daphnia magna TaxID=35525 RepID=A0ABR0AFN4_9CRUS|nr:hypothetical protein OUZ56_009202 [Daphnia magna]